MFGLAAVGSRLQSVFPVLEQPKHLPNFENGRLTVPLPETFSLTAVVAALRQLQRQILCLEAYSYAGAVHNYTHLATMVEVKA